MFGSTISTALFVCVASLEFICLLILLVSILNPKKRLWPPPRKKSWQQIAALSAAFAPQIIAVPLGIFDWNSFVYFHWSRYVVGAAMMAAGFLLNQWAVQSLSVSSSLGHEGTLVQTGAYKYSRNPQYIGHAAFFLGYAVLCNSILTYIAAVIGIGLYVLTPFTEEPWLKDQYGLAYAEYTKKVPRFIGLRKK